MHKSDVAEVLDQLHGPARTILASIAAGDDDHRTFLLKVLPLPLEEQLLRLGVLADSRNLSALGDEVASALAYEAGFVPLPESVDGTSGHHEPE